MINLICRTCGVQFQRKPAKVNANKTGRFYCSRECSWHDQIGRERPEMRGRPGWGAGRTKETDPRIAKMAETLTIEPPDRDELYCLYTIENQSMAKIGQRFGVTKGTVKRWVIQYALIRRRDLLTQSVLERLTDAGLTHMQIGEMYNCTNSHVSKLAKQYGLDAIHRNTSLDLDADELYRLYWDERLTYNQIGEILNCAGGTIGNWMNRFDIPVRAGGTYDHNLVTKDGHCVRSSLELQVDDWLFAHGIEHEYEPRIPGTRSWADFLVGETYIEVWGMIRYEPYIEKQSQKTEMYHQLGLDLLSVYPHDFPELLALEGLLA